MGNGLKRMNALGGTEGHSGWLAGVLLFLIAFAVSPGRCAAAQRGGSEAGKLHYRKGLAAFGKHDWREAIRQLRWTLEYLPKSPDVHNSLGQAYLADGNTDRAAIEFRRAVALRPDFAEAYYNMAQALERRKDENGATQFYKWAIKAQLPTAEAHDAQGFILAHQGDLPGAESEFEAALKDDPSLAVAHFHLGTAFWREKRYQEAVAELKKSLALDPSNPMAKDNLDLASQHLSQSGGGSRSSGQ